MGMFKGLHLTGGIGVKTALNIHLKSIGNALENQFMTFVTSVKEKKESKIVQHRELTIQLRSLGSLEYFQS